MSTVVLSFVTIVPVVARHEIGAVPVEQGKPTLMCSTVALRGTWKISGMQNSDSTRMRIPGRHSVVSGGVYPVGVAGMRFYMPYGCWSLGVLEVRNAEMAGTGS